MSDEFAQGEVSALAARGLLEETCRKFSYWVGKNKDGKTCQIANYRRDGRTVAQKLRFKDKKFAFIGDSKQAGLFGQHLWQPTRRLVITEGEIDALSVAQVLGLKWPVVSVPNGAQGAAKSIKRELEWVEAFDEVVIMFDMDEPGQAAAQEVAAILSPGKARIAQLPMKDPNEMLKAGNGEAIVSCIYEAQTVRPDGIVTFGSVREKALAPVVVGMPWPWDDLTTYTLGRRYGEIYGLGAGTGMGKSDVFDEIIVFTATTCNEKCGVLKLEQPPAETAKRLAGKYASKRFHVPDAGWSQQELEDAFDILDSTGNVVLYDHFGTTDWEVIASKMRHMVVADGVKHIFLDHLTALAADAEDEKKVLEQVMAALAKLAMELNVCIYFISHLTTPEKGSPHEEGGRVTIRQFKGSRAIGFWSHFMFGLERDQQAGNERIRTTTTLRVLKDRYTGQATGKCIYLAYDEQTGRLVPTTDPYEDDDDGSNFGDESGSPY
ncbi:toprim domain-containing protein [Xanthomonas tesorieronis]|uniref:toprim domain-containing protein n=1 Tax=Xanthomonas tesorieronis TaxID=3160839 RepID=UPI003516F3B1